MLKCVLLAVLVTTVRVLPTPPPQSPTPFGLAPRLLHKWGSYGEGPGQFIYVADLAVDRRGDVYVLDENRGLIRKFASDGTLLLEWGATIRLAPASIVHARSSSIVPSFHASTTRASHGRFARGSGSSNEASTRSAASTTCLPAADPRISVRASIRPRVRGGGPAPAQQVSRDRALCEILHDASRGGEGAG